MPRIQERKVQATAIADADSVLKASIRHWDKMKPFGVTETERKTFEAVIREASDWYSRVPSAEVPALENCRQRLKDLLGGYRNAGDLVADGFAGRDEQLLQALRVGNAFPNTDLKLKKYVAGLTAVLKKFSARLAARGFKKDSQDALVEAIAEFNTLLNARGAERGERRARRVAQEALFDRLRRQSSYFRRVGRSALHTDDRRAEFDRVKIGARPKAALHVVEPEPEVAEGGQG